ncbi:MAG: hypothetical protein JWO94_3478 [Verrucomicrobiaceae bacterium]|nr:hypothetical protein [Verrucomicrobiaceae bacterium]
MSIARANILSVDVEKNGLHGPTFSVGAVVIDRAGMIVDSFRARCPIVGEPRPFVTREVLPALVDYVETHRDYKSLRDDFWAWFSRHKEQCHVFADCGWPSEARFFIALAEDDLESRYTSGPYPLHDVATLMLACGADPDTNREDFVGIAVEMRGRKHDPWWDALVSARCALQALASLGTLNGVLQPVNGN